tara:strand:- start:16 stop:771 length:756 start_codon:yes stop_codon:yes gene_type:complete
MLNWKLRELIIRYFTIIRNIKKYKLIIPKILSKCIWPLLKPKKITYDKKIFLTSTKNYPSPSRDLFAYGKIYNSWEKEIIYKRLEKGSNCIDIGANIGFFTYLFLEKVGKSGKIFSFENIPEVFVLLKKNFEKDTNVRCQLGEVGVKAGQLIIDKLIDIKISFIKIDIDGADLFALKSCENIIKRDKPEIIVELSEASEREHGIHYNKVIEFLHNNSYKLFEIDKKLVKFDRNLKENEVINIFALHFSQKL